MTAALVGLLGVIAGALLGGVVKSKADRRLRRVEVVATARIMAIELRSTAFTLRTVVTSGEWWVGELPVRLWDARSLAVAYDLDEPKLGEVENTYRLLRNLNASTRSIRQAGYPRELTEKTKSRLSDCATKAEDAASVLNRGQSDLLSKRQHERLRMNVGLIVAAILALVVAGSLLFQTVPDRSEPAVSHALETALGTGYLADCDAAGNDWACQVLATAPGCPLELTPTAFTPTPETTGRHIQGAVVSDLPVLRGATFVSFATQDRCLVVGAPTTADVSDAGADLLNGEGQLPGAAEHAARFAWQFEGPTESRWNMFLKRLAGSD
jgi:hypothetical protein